MAVRELGRHALLLLLGGLLCTHSPALCSGVSLLVANCPSISLARLSPGDSSIAAETHHFLLSPIVTCLLLSAARSPPLPLIWLFSPLPPLGAPLGRIAKSRGEF